jgi:asparaginyl-tRNA synthetase
MSNGPAPSVSGLSNRLGETVTLKGWLYNRRDSGKIRFLVFRDGSGYLQCVVVKKEVPEEVWEASGQLTQESTLEVTGVVREAPRQEGGVELGVTGLSILSLCHDWPITPKEHGVDFLMSQRHLWLRSARQVAILKVRSEVESAIHDFYHSREYTKVDSPILTPNACEGTSNLFETQYTEDEKAYLSQSGQLYLEPACAALGKVYCFGPTFRAEKSKTRRHLREFWMVEPEVAFLEIDGLMDLAEEFVKELTARVLDRRREDLKRLERDTAKLEATAGKAFPRIDYRDAVGILQGKGFPVKFGDDFGGDEETALAEGFDTPVMVTRYPAAIKSFYMQPDPNDPEVVLGLDMLAPEGYGEIIGGSQRIHDHDLLLSRIHQHELPLEAFQWYLDVRKYGSFPHSGFGMGLERFTAWMCGVPHLRECIPYPRMLYRIYP